MGIILSLCYVLESGVGVLLLSGLPLHINTVIVNQHNEILALKEIKCKVTCFILTWFGFCSDIRNKWMNIIILVLHLSQKCAKCAIFIIYFSAWSPTLFTKSFALLGIGKNIHFGEFSHKSPCFIWNSIGIFFSYNKH